MTKPKKITVINPEISHPAETQRLYSAPDTTQASPSLDSYSVTHADRRKFIRPLLATVSGTNLASNATISQHQTVRNAVDIHYEPGLHGPELCIAMATFPNDVKINETNAASQAKEAVRIAQEVRTMLLQHTTYTDLFTKAATDENALALAPSQPQSATSQQQAATTPCVLCARTYTRTDGTIDIAGWNIGDSTLLAYDRQKNKFRVIVAGERKFDNTASAIGTSVAPNSFHEKLNENEIVIPLSGQVASGLPLVDASSRLLTAAASPVRRQSAQLNSNVKIDIDTGQLTQDFQAQLGQDQRQPQDIDATYIAEWIMSLSRLGHTQKLSTRNAEPSLITPQICLDTLHDEEVTADALSFRCTFLLTKIAGLRRTLKDSQFEIALEHKLLAIQEALGDTGSTPNLNELHTQINQHDLSLAQATLTAKKCAVYFGGDATVTAIVGPGTQIARAIMLETLGNHMPVKARCCFKATKTPVLDELAEARWGDTEAKRAYDNEQKKPAAKRNLSVMSYKEPSEQRQNADFAIQLGITLQSLDTHSSSIPEAGPMICAAASCLAIRTAGPQLQQQLPQSTYGTLHHQASTQQPAQSATGQPAHAANSSNYRTL